MSEDQTRTFEELEVWQSARSLRIFVFRKITPILLDLKEYDLNNQIKRASRSITHNIAEGHGRYHFLDNSRFCSNARGSLNEFLDQLIICYDDSLIDEVIYQEGREHFNRTLRILNGYMSWLRKAANKGQAVATPDRPL